jgi:hypothetical protein
MTDLTERYRYLLFKTEFDGDDISFLIEAAGSGDTEIIKHCFKYGLKCNSMQAISAAADGEHYNVIDAIAVQNTGCKIGLHCAENLIRNKNKKMLYYLHEKNMIGEKAIFMFINLM